MNDDGSSQKAPSKLKNGRRVITLLLSLGLAAQFWACSFSGPWCEIMSEDTRWLWIDGHIAPTNNPFVSIPTDREVTLRFTAGGVNVIRIIRRPRSGDVYLHILSKPPYLDATGVEVWDPARGEFVPRGLPRGLTRFSIFLAGTESTERLVMPAISTHPWEDGCIDCLQPRA